MIFPRWAKEPLFHFLIGGFAIYLLFAWRGEPVDPASRTIELSREDQAQLSLGFERMMGRAPTDAELDRQVDKFVREEVLYREALRLGLDENDGVVRRRLAQKMDMLAAAQAETAQPSEATLKAWYDDHQSRLADDARYTLDQAYKSEMAGAKALIGALNAQSSNANFADLSDPISLPSTITEMSRKEVLDRFGEQFVVAIETLESGDAWQGPVQSGFGWHGVRLRRRDVGKVPPISEIRQKVEDDWRRSTIAERKRRGFEILREAYTIEIAE